MAARRLACSATRRVSCPLATSCQNVACTHLGRRLRGPQPARQRLEVVSRVRAVHEQEGVRRFGRLGRCRLARNGALVHVCQVECRAETPMGVHAERLHGMLRHASLLRGAQFLSCEDRDGRKRNIDFGTLCRRWMTWRQLAPPTRGCPRGAQHTAALLAGAAAAWGRAGKRGQLGATWRCTTRIAISCRCCPWNP